MDAIVLEAATDEDFRWLLGEIPATRSATLAPDLAPPEVLAIVRGLPVTWLILADSELVGIPR